MTVLHYLRAVLWGFFGVRRGMAARRDDVALRLLPLLATAVLLAGGLVLTLVTVVRLVTAGGA